MVTVTPVTLNVAMEKTPKIQKKSNEPDEPAYLKYVKGLYKKGSDLLSNTQAACPKVHGI